MNRFIKAVGAGAKRARALDRDEARAAMALIAGGDAEPVQVGAFLLALRMKGETAAELAGFADALAAHTAGIAAPVDALEVDAHGDGHGDRASLLAAAACAAAAIGVPVCLSVERGSPFARHGLDGALASIGLGGLDGALDPGRAARDLGRAGVGACELARACPPLARLVGLRPLLGVRTAAQTVAKLVSVFAPASRRRLVGIFHAPYLALTAEALALAGAERGLVVQALGGLPEARPGRIVRVADAAVPATVRAIDLRPMNEEDAAGRDALDGAAVTRGALDGTDRAAMRAAAAAAAILVHSATGADPLDAARTAFAALEDGRARAVAAKLA